MCGSGQLLLRPMTPDPQATSEWPHFCKISLSQNLYMWSHKPVQHDWGATGGGQEVPHHISEQSHVCIDPVSISRQWHP